MTAAEGLGPGARVRVPASASRVLLGAYTMRVATVRPSVVEGEAVISGEIKGTGRVHTGPGADVVQLAGVEVLEPARELVEVFTAAGERLYTLAQLVDLIPGATLDGLTSRRRRGRLGAPVWLDQRTPLWTHPDTWGPGGA